MCSRERTIEYTTIGFGDVHNFEDIFSKVPKFKIYGMQLNKIASLKRLKFLWQNFEGISSELWISPLSIPKPSLTETYPSKIWSNSFLDG